MSHEALERSMRRLVRELRGPKYHNSDTWWTAYETGRRDALLDASEAIERRLKLHCKEQDK